MILDTRNSIEAEVRNFKHLNAFLVFRNHRRIYSRGLDWPLLHFSIDQSRPVAFDVIHVLYWVRTFNLAYMMRLQ